MSSVNAINGYPMGIDEQYDLIRQSVIPSEEKSVKKETFKDVLGEFLAPVNEADFNNKVSNAEIMLGDVDNLHSTVIAGQYAELSVKLALAVRNKVVDAYNEVMRMQI